MTEYERKGKLFMKSLFKNVTNKEYEVLKLILENPNSCPADFFFDDPTIDGRIEELEKHHLIKLDSNAIISITELGRAALVEYDEMLAQQENDVRKERFRFWFPTIISLLALAASFISLALQLLSLE